MRALHNSIKKSLIASNNAETVLDISVGRFGDLHSYAGAGAKSIVGVDPNPKSIEEAVERAKIYPDIETRLSVLKVTHERVDLSRPVHLAVCNFSIHYFFESEEMLRTALDNVARNLMVGGRFVGTMTNPILEGAISEDYVIQPKNDTGTPYGNEYLFALIDDEEAKGYFQHTEVLPEFQVSLDELRRVAAEVGLRFIRSVPFARAKCERDNLRKRMSDSETLVSAMYSTFEFVKVADNFQASV